MSPIQLLCVDTFDTDLVIKSFKDNITGFVHLDKINFIVIFGSFSTGKAHSLSDIDICVSISNYNELSSSERFQIAADLLTNFEKTISSDLIDLSIWEMLNPNLRFNVLKNGVVIYHKSKRYYQEITSQTLKVYWDQKEWHDKLVNAVFAGDGK